MYLRLLAKIEFSGNQRGSSQSILFVHLHVTSPDDRMLWGLAEGIVKKPTVTRFVVDIS